MMTTNKTMFLALGVVLAAGCAGSGSPNEPGAETATNTDADAIIGTAYYGLSVKDCNMEFIGCLKNAPEDRFVSTSLACRSQLAACLGDIASSAVGAVVEQAHEVKQCGQDGLVCYGDADHLGAVLDCHNGVQVCVNASVKEVTGIELPTTREVVATATQTTVDAADAAIGIAHTAVEHAVDDAHAAASAAVGITVYTVQTTEDIAHTAVTGAVQVAHDAVDTAVNVADAVTRPARHLLDCTVQAQLCRWGGGGFSSCTNDFEACLSDAKEPVVN